MSILKGDIRLIQGNIASTVGAIKGFLLDQGYEISSECIGSDSAEVRADNCLKSVLKLYVSNSPQKIRFHIQKRMDDYLRVAVTCDLFMRFRLFYYTVLGLLLLGSSALFVSIGQYKFPSNMISECLSTYSEYSFAFLISAGLFIGGMAFYLKSINTKSYESLINEFYNTRTGNGFRNVEDIQVGHIFPDLWRGLFVTGLFVIFAFIHFDFISILDKSMFIGIFGWLLIVTVGLLGALLFFMITKPGYKSRVLFVLAGVSLTVPILIYLSPPIVLSIPGDISFLIEGLKHSHKTQMLIERVAIVFPVFTLLCFIFGAVFLVSWVRLPSRLIQHVEKFQNSFPESSYFQALNPENNLIIFNFLLVSIWVVFSILKIFGLYISFSIMELCFFDHNYLFGIDFSTLFFENTKVVALILLNDKISDDTIVFFHKATMAAYSIPLILVLFVVLWKNIKSALNDFFLVNRQSSFTNQGVEIKLYEKVKRICGHEKLRAPGIKLLDSSELSGAETKYISFPIFKNYIFISKDLWQILDEDGLEIDVMLAHEIGHIKRHNLLRKFLCFLSDYSLFGNGFLAVLQNSFQVERDADQFAVKWLSVCHVDRSQAIEELKTLLEKIEELGFRDMLFKKESPNFSFFKITSYRDKYLKNYNESSFWEKTKTNLKILYQIYFGNEILSYFHPPTSLRIAWLKEAFQDET